MQTKSLLIALALCSAFCSDPDSDLPDASVADLGPPAVDIAVDIGVDAGVDLGVLDAGEVPCSYGPSTPTALPVAEDGIVELGDPTTVDTYSATFEEDCRITVYFESANEDFTSGTIMSRSSEDLINFSAPITLDLGPETIHANPNVVLDETGARYFYFAKTEGIFEPATLWRARVEQGLPTALEMLPSIMGASGLLSWPRFQSLNDGRVAVAYRDDFGRPQARIGDGLTFGSPAQVSDESIAIPTLGQREGGGLVYTFQVPSATFIAYYASSDDGINWSSPLPLTPNSSNVHDAILIRRLDGDLDAYYIYPTGAHGFSIHRRAILSDESLGPEEVVTTQLHGNTQKPKLKRLSDDSLLLTWARVTSQGAQGAPIALALTMTRVVGDAARP